MSSFNPPLQIVDVIATKRGDPERGPAVWLRSEEAQMRMLVEGELAWISGPRRKELAEVHFDDALPRGAVRVRDLFGATVTELVTITKPDTDTPTSRGLA